MTDNRRGNAAKNKDRHVLGLSRKASIAYLRYKLDLLKEPPAWSLSDSNIIEFMVARLLDPTLDRFAFRPSTWDARPKSGRPIIHGRYSKKDDDMARTPSAASYAFDHKEQTIERRTARTQERLDHLLSLPDREDRRGSNAKNQQRVKDIDLR